MLNVNGKLWECLNKVTNLIVLNVVFIIGCLPIITIGASKAALYCVIDKMDKNEEGSILREYFMGFKKQFKKSSVVWIGYCIVVFLIVLNIYALINIQVGWMETFLMMATVLVFFTASSAFIYIFILWTRGDTSVKKGLLDGSLLAIVNLPCTMLVLLVEFLPFVLVFFFTEFWLYIITYYVVVGFSLGALIHIRISRKMLSRIID